MNADERNDLRRKGTIDRLGSFPSSGSGLDFAPMVPLCKDKALSSEYLELLSSIGEHAVTVISLFLPKQLIELIIYHFVGLKYRFDGGIQCTTAFFNNCHIVFWAANSEDFTTIPHLMLNYAQIVIASEHILNAKTPFNIYELFQHLVLITSAEEIENREEEGDRWTCEYILQSNVSTGVWFTNKIYQVMRLNLRHNWQYANYVSSELNSLILTQLIRNQFKTQQAVQCAIQQYQDKAANHYTQQIKAILLPLSNRQLVDALSQIKTNFIVSIKKQLNGLALSSVAAKWNQICENAFRNLVLTCNQEEEKRFNENVLIAQKRNADILSKLKEQYKKRDLQTETGLTQLEGTLRSLMEDYASSSIVVESQLQTFNGFMKENKDHFLTRAEKMVRASKRLSVDEKDQLDARIEIQTNILNILTKQVHELEERRTAAETINLRLKHKIQKADQIPSDLLTTSSKDITKPISLHYNRQNKAAQKMKSSSKCCCLLI